MDKQLDKLSSGLLADMVSDKNIKLLLNDEIGTVITSYSIHYTKLYDFSLFVQMSEGATFSVVPFVNKKAVGAVSGIVGAGGNAGAVMAGFLLKMENVSYSDALLYLGIAVTIISLITFAVRFTEEAEIEAQEEMEMTLKSA